MFSVEAFARGQEQVDKALTLTNVEARRLLDLCCGPGRHTIPLALKGLDVTAVDLSPFLLERAQDHARKANFITNGSVHRFQFTHRIYSGQELRELMISADFAKVALFGDLDGCPYGPGAMRLVAVGRKAST